MATSGVNSSSTNPYASTSSGVSTDIAARVQQTLASQNAGVTKLNTALTKDQTKLSGLGQLQSALASFQNIAKGLSGDGLSTSAATSVKNVLTAASTGSAKAGTYAIDVKQLAQGQFLTSDAFAAADSKIGTGAATTIKIDFGTAGAAGKGFTANASGAKSITLDGSNNTLDGIAAAFKAAGVDVSVVKGDKGYTLAIAGQSGAANSLRISVSGDAALKDLLAFDPDGKQNLTQTKAAQDALLTVDGTAVTSPSNTLDKAIPGATLSLTGAGKTNVTIAQDAGQIASNVKAFVSAYNDLNKKLQDLQKGSLKSDTALGQVSNSLGLLLRTGGGSVSSAALSAAGVSLDGSGNLKLDEAKLKTAITADSSAVSKLFTGDGKGLADLLSAKIGTLSGEGGSISRETASVNKDIASINGKRTVLAKALTSQATALAALYTAQAQTGAGSAFNGIGGGSTGTLFDLLG